jgi:hypothetical protein
VICQPTTDGELWCAQVLLWIHKRLICRMRII